MKASRGGAESHRALWRTSRSSAEQLPRRHRSWCRALRSAEVSTWNFLRETETPLSDAPSVVDDPSTGAASASGWGVPLALPPLPLGSSDNSSDARHWGSAASWTSSTCFCSLRPCLAFFPYPRGGHRQEESDPLGADLAGTGPTSRPRSGRSRHREGHWLVSVGSEPEPGASCPLRVQLKG